MVEATDQDGDMLVFSVFGELPEGAKFDKTRRQFTWTANPNQVGQLVILTFAVTDGDLEDQETVQMTVVSERDKSAPELTPPGDQLVRVGETLELRLEATDPDGDTLSFGIDGPAPQGGSQRWGGWTSRTTAPSSSERTRTEKACGWPAWFPERDT